MPSGADRTQERHTYPRERGPPAARPRPLRLGPEERLRLGGMLGGGLQREPKKEVSGARGARHCWARSGAKRDDASVLQRELTVTTDGWAGRRRQRWRDGFQRRTTRSCGHGREFDGSSWLAMRAKGRCDGEIVVMCRQVPGTAVWRCTTAEREGRRAGAPQCCPWASPSPRGAP